MRSCPAWACPCCTECDAALALLQENLKALCAGRPEEARQIAAADSPALEKVTDHVWCTTHTESINWFVISDSGKALVIDYGYMPDAGPARRRVFQALSPARACCTASTRCSEQFGIDRVDVALISHFHDDHVCGVPLLQRLFDTQCWASVDFADLLADPDAHCFPCDWPQPIRIDRRIRYDEAGALGGVRVPLCAHERPHALRQPDRLRGRRQTLRPHRRPVFLHAPRWHLAGTRRRSRSPAGTTRCIFQNHVYRNGALLDGYTQSGDWLLAWRPDIVLSGHQKAMITDPNFFDLVAQWSHEYQGSTAASCPGRRRDPLQPG